MRHKVELWGPYGLFTKPGLKVERFSYPVPTPSSMRGILDAIYVKPTKFYWAVKAILLLAQSTYLAVSRNEIKEHISKNNVKQWMKGKSVKTVIVDAQEQNYGRTQRQSMILTGVIGADRNKGVHYCVEAEIKPRPGYEKDIDEFNEQFIRRVDAGQCHHHPYMGCREFPVYFKMADEQTPKPINYTADLGVMLYDCFDVRVMQKHFVAPVYTVFHAKVKNGILTVPDIDSEGVKKPE